MGRLVHFEIPSTNPENALKFYSKVFNWTAQKWGETDYWLVETGKAETPGINGAITLKKDFYTNVINTINVENIDKTIEDIMNNGGKVITAKMDIPNIGVMVYFKDPDGNVSGAMQGTGSM